MIRCHFARLLGDRKLKISDVARDTGINRNTLTRLYQETVERYDAEVLDRLDLHPDFDPRQHYALTVAETDEWNAPQIATTLSCVIRRSASARPFCGSP